MAFTRGERAALTIALRQIRERAEAAGQTDFDGDFFDRTDEQQRTALTPEVTKLRDLAQEALDGFRANETNLAGRVDALNALLTKLRP